ncbi:MAG TPA: hypothetical protein VKF81_03380 [Blastocatellia bacterium]|nr:hypothetical protein [Blastocatellia bacterium]
MDTEFERSGGRELTRRQNARLRRNLTDYREWIWYVNGNGCSVTPSKSVRSAVYLAAADIF